MTNNEYAASLRLIADFYDANPDMPQHGNFGVYLFSKKEFIAAALTLSKGGRVEKSVDDSNSTLASYHAKRTFGSVTVDVSVPRSTVCRLVRPAEYECPDSLLEEAAEYTEVEA